MIRTILLDTSPLGVLTNPRTTPKTTAARTWLQGLLTAGHRILIPAICDYELRREFLLRGSLASLLLLDDLIRTHAYLDITSVVIRRAAELWATARRSGTPTTPPAAIDADVILAAQALTLNDPAAVIATGNVAHLNRYVHAVDWTQFHP
jgi:predicted nucleic acid-binding protein